MLCRRSKFDWLYFICCDVASEFLTSRSGVGVRQARLDFVFCSRLLSKNKRFQLFHTCLGLANIPTRAPSAPGGSGRFGTNQRQGNEMTNKAMEQLHLVFIAGWPNQLLVAINTSSPLLLHNRQAWQNFGTLHCLSCLPVIGADVLPRADLMLGKGKPTAEIDGAVPSQRDNT